MASHTVQEFLTPRPQSLRFFALRLNSVVTKSLKGRDIIYGRRDPYIFIFQQLIIYVFPISFYSQVFYV